LDSTALNGERFVCFFAFCFKNPLRLCIGLFYYTYPPQSDLFFKDIRFR
jgi:hypothetical protein